MDKIQIVSWLLTRRCNLHCSYCRISRDYDRPLEYTKILRYFYQNEMKTEYILEALRRLKLHNPNHFNIFYGGEPTLRKDLPEIIEYCNNENINYTIITNHSGQSQLEIKNILNKVGNIQGLTTSIDPISDSLFKSDQVRKTYDGWGLLQYKGKIKDLVAEITTDNYNLYNLHSLVKNLTEKGINSDITFIDIAKSPYYDFSNVTDERLLVNKSQELRDIINKIIDDKLNVHMRDILLPAIYDILPSNLDCKIEKDVHNITIDSDGSIRLCLRIAGVKTQSTFNLLNFLDENENLYKSLKVSLAEDKEKYCLGCNWTCQIMSSLTSKNEGNIDNLLHSERRSE